MNTDKKIQPILITGVERSGSTFIARILDMCGVFSGSCNKMFENIMIHSLHYEMFVDNRKLFTDTNNICIPHSWKEIILKEIEQEGGYNDQNWMVKGGILAQCWPVWKYAFPDAKWIIVRRKTGDVIQSCIKTGYMRKFKNPDNLHFLGLTEEKDGWLWWIHQYEQKYIEMIQNGLNYREVWPERMRDGDFEQVKEIVNWCGLNWNSKVEGLMQNLLNTKK
jgi:hypothetical protein